MKSSNYIKPKLIDTEVRDIVLVKNEVIPKIIFLFLLTNNTYNIIKIDIGSSSNNFEKKFFL